MKEQSLLSPGDTHTLGQSPHICPGSQPGPALAKSSEVTKERGRGHSTGKAPRSALSELEVMTQTAQPWPSALPGSVAAGLTITAGLQGCHFPFLTCPSFLAQTCPQSVLLIPKHQPGNAPGHALATVGAQLFAMSPPSVSHLPLGHPRHRQSSCRFAPNLDVSSIR